MRKSVLIGLGFVAGLLVSFGMRLFDAPRVEAQPGAARWEHKRFETASEGVDKTLSKVDAGGWEYSGFSASPQEPVFKRLKK